MKFAVPLQAVVIGYLEIEAETSYDALTKAKEMANGTLDLSEITVNSTDFEVFDQVTRMKT
jgi:hypothetical protein